MLGYFHGVLESTLDEYLNLISTKHGIKFSELKELMNDVKGNNTLPPPVVAVVKRKIPNQGDGNTCGHITQRGKNIGAICGKKVKKDCDFCSLHSKKTATVTTIEVETKDVPVVQRKPNPVLRKNHIINKWWHPDSGLVFKSSEEKIVIGIYKDEQLVDLSEEDVATCISYKFKYVTKRKRSEDDIDNEQPKKQKVEKVAAVVNVIDEQFIKVNQDAKNVEVIIKEMFNTKSNEEDDDDADDEEEHEDPIPDWDGVDGAEETKENYTREVDDVEEDEQEDMYEGELLLEEEDS